MTQATGTRQAAPPVELRRTIITLMLLIGAMGAFWYHARLYWELTEDDAYISFQYARNLVRGVFQPEWNAPRTRAGAELEERRSMRIAEGAQPDRLRLVALAHDGQGRLAAMAMSHCKP